MITNVSDFKNRITIEKREQKKDNNGYNSTIEVTNIMNCWAKLTDFYSKELYASFGTKLENGVNITVRYCKTLSLLNSSEYKDKLFIVLNCTSYKVQHIDFHNANKELITFKVVVVK